MVDKNTFITRNSISNLRTFAADLDRGSSVEAHQCPAGLFVLLAIFNHSVTMRPSTSSRSINSPSHRSDLR